MTNVYDFRAKAISGEEISLSKFKGEVLLIVNTASKCGFTPQYKGLEQLHRALHPRGFEVLGFRCNQFARQEPGDASEIQNFCSLTYGVTFPVFAKIEVNGANTHPLYRFLKKAKRGFLGSQSIKWNFTKFLIDRNGNAAGRFAPTETPEKLQPRIEALL